MLIFVKILNMLYNKFSYIYPPRPKNAAPSSDIERYDNDAMLGQPKINGSNTTIYTNGELFYVYNRHGEKLTNFRLEAKEIIDNLYKCKDNKWMVINGEYLNKNKNDETGKPFNHKLIIFDILVYDSDHLLNKSFQERVDLLDELYGTIDSEKDYLYKISENIYRVKSYYKNFDNLYKNAIKVDMLEGLVLKRKNAKLGTGKTSCSNSQVKFRKQCNSYLF